MRSKESTNENPSYSSKAPQGSIDHSQLHNRSSSSKLCKGGLCPLVHTLSPATSRILHSQFFCSFFGFFKLSSSGVDGCTGDKLFGKPGRLGQGEVALKSLHLLLRVILVHFGTFFGTLWYISLILVHFGTFLNDVTFWYILSTLWYIFLRVSLLWTLTWLSWCIELGLVFQTNQYSAAQGFA